MNEHQIQYEKLYLALRKSELGMTRPVFELLIAALIREGYLIGYKGVTPVELEKCRLPLSDSIDLLTIGQLIDEQSQNTVLQIVNLLFKIDATEFNIALQESIWQNFKKIKDKNEALIIQLEKEFKTFPDFIPVDNNNLTETFQIINQMAKFCKAIDPFLSSRSGLEKIIESVSDAIDELARFVQGFERISKFFKDKKPIYLEIIRYLNNSALTIPEAPEYNDLIELRNDTLLDQEMSDKLILFGGIDRLYEHFVNFRDRYRQRYILEHKNFQQELNIKGVEECRQSSIYQILQRFSKIEKLSVEDHYQKFDKMLDQLIDNHCVLLKETELTDHPRCGCNFHLGKKHDKPAVNEIQAGIERGIRQYMELLQHDELIYSQLDKYLTTMIDLQRDMPMDDMINLLRLDATNPNADLIRELNNILTSDVINEINQALKTTIRFVERDMKILIEKLQGRHFTKEGIKAAFLEWLNSGEPAEKDVYLKIINTKSS